jgi:hypothetical protein
MSFAPHRIVRVGFGAGLAAAAALAALAPVYAGEADVVAARAECSAESVCRFEVTIRHADTGWDHYADGWDVLRENGEILATRVLRHPHVGEQPFTRSLPGVSVPVQVDRVRIRAHDSVHETGGAEIVVEITRGE